jgi:hypothetical protein
VKITEKKLLANFKLDRFTIQKMFVNNKWFCLKLSKPVNGWMDEKALTRISYSNQKSFLY